jgi:hypothetical protein
MFIKVLFFKSSRINHENVYACQISEIIISKCIKVCKAIFHKLLLIFMNYLINLKNKVYP